MHRDLDRLTERTFDLLVVGGGIYGLIVACDAAQRGLDVALIERKDFGSGASFNHLRTIHGGLRYLQTLDVARARESVRERRTLARIAPWALEPLPFALPLDASITKGSLAMRAGFLLDSLIARDRNFDVPATHHLPTGSVITASEARRRFPILEGIEMDGAALWHDYVTTDADRLTFSWALSAVAKGAVLANYVEATALIVDRGRCQGVRAEDRIGGRTLEISALVILNAAGGSVDAVLTPSGLATGIPMIRAMNLVTKRPGPPGAVGARSANGRALFVVPWRNRALFGTWESSTLAEPGDTAVRQDDVARFLQDINTAFPSIKLEFDEVTLVHRGIVPATLTGGGVSLARHERIIDHGGLGAEGLLTVAGTKYTTARAVAERLVDRVLLKLGRPPVPCRTTTTVLPAPAALGEQDERLADAAENEMVVTLEDAVVRRTPIGALGEPDEVTLQRAARIVGGVQRWSRDRQAAEIAALKAFYRG